MNLPPIKKFIVSFMMVIFHVLIFPSAAQAQTSFTGGASEGYLKQIAEYTKGMLDRLNNIPDYLNSLGVLIKAWTEPDDSDTSISLSGNFSEVGKLLAKQQKNQETLGVKINNDLLNNGLNTALNTSFNLPSGAIVPMALYSSLPYANDLVYTTLLNRPFFGKDPRDKGKTKVDTAYNYIRNASGLNIYHPIPGSNWNGGDAALSRYQNYYNTVMAVESFNAYVLSQEYVDRGQLNSLQSKLIDQATNADTWFSVVQSETIGFVLRQILMYESQVFVFLSELLKVQKQAVNAQVMTNSLLIAINQLNESMLISNAQGNQPGT